ncbi:hypothetical protein [Embleya hyalina]|uniref:Uncharacterized protein n=1 Tax=Embleya hyalina TaxID=516124 RepID=A0A401YGC0_9ACTN|nr:hypothetical protein [Embleya hyalina]GCD93661.1 hypothetical protein EHYA_01306 [Embleya hyalina]
MTVWVKVCWWGLAVVGGLAAVALVVWMSAADLERSSQWAGVIGTLIALSALGVALWQVRTTPPGPGPSPSEPVHAETGSIAARGNIRNASARGTATGAGSPTPPTGPGISASDGSIAAGGDVEGSTAHHGP